MEKINFNEAFKALTAIDEDMFDITPEDSERLKNLLDTSDKFILTDVIDIEADDEEEIQDSYEGKVILQCPICKENMFKNPEEVVIDEETDKANIEDVCPACQSMEGFYIVGEVKPYCDECENEEEKPEEVKDEVEVKDEEEIDFDEDKLDEALGLDEATKEEWDSIEIIDKGNNWVKWYFRDGDTQYTGSAKVFAEPSEYGINGGKVSKFNAKADEEEIANYDRGWDVRPKAEHKKAINEIIRQLEENAPNINIGENLKENKQLKEDWGGDLLEIADYILDRFKNEKEISWNDFNDAVEDACRELLGQELDFEGTIKIDGKNREFLGDIDSDLRTIMSMNGWQTEFEGDNEGGLKLVESKKSLKEMSLYDLRPQYSGRASFHNKATVDIDDKTGEKTLYSYNTPVVKITKEKEVKLLPKWDSSATTLRHVKEFLKQNNFTADSLKQIRQDYLKESSERDKIDADADDKKEKARKLLKKKLDDADSIRDERKKSAKKSFRKAQDDADADRDFKLKRKGLKENRPLNETGEWEDDEEGVAWKQELLNKIRKNTPYKDTTLDDIRGFDKYQGPYAYIDGVEFWLDGETLALLAHNLNHNKMSDSNWYQITSVKDFKDMEKGSLKPISESCRFIKNKKGLKESNINGAFYGKQGADTDFPNEVRKYLGVELEDDETEEGGVAFAGETLFDFLTSLGDENLNTMEEVNKALKACGIKPIEVKKLQESDKPAAISIEDAQKWVDYDMKRYGKISNRTNRLVDKAGFRIDKDQYGDYEVVAGTYESCNEKAEVINRIFKKQPNKKITPETSLRRAVEILTPDEFQLEYVTDDISLKDAWDKMKNGEDFYKFASVDGEGFDSAVREKIFAAMEDTLNLDYDDIYNVWLRGPESLKESSSKDPSNSILRDIQKAKAKLNGKKPTENFGESEIRKLKDKYFDYRYGQYSSAYSLIDDFADWCANYTGTNENLKEDCQRLNETGEKEQFILVDKDGKEIKEKSKIKAFDGSEYTFEMISRVPQPGKSGKITVITDEGDTMEYYPSVFDLKIIKKEGMEEDFTYMDGHKVKVFYDFNKAKEYAEKLGLIESEYGDKYNTKYSYCLWNKSGNRNDDEDVYAIYVFDEKGKPRALTDEEIEDVNIKWDLDTDKYLEEDFERVDIETDREKMSMTADENGKVTVTTEPKTEEVKEIKDEVIEPVSDEVKAKFKTEDEFDEVDFDEFEEETFDNLGEKYLRKVYENVKEFKTTGGSIKGNQLKLEGIITFKSGNKAKTNFVFESKTIRKGGQLKFEGYNKQFARGDKAFTLVGTLKENKLVCESLTYNYTAKDDKTNESKKLYGTVRK